MDLKDNYKIGITIDALSSIDQLRKFNDLMSGLSRRMGTVSKKIDIFNDSLLATSKLLPKIIAQLNVFGVSAATNLGEAAASGNAFNRSLNKGGSRERGLGRAIGGELGREMGAPGRVGSMAAADFIGGPVGMGLLGGAYLGFTGFKNYANVSRLSGMISSEGFGPMEGQYAEKLAMSNPRPGISFAGFMQAYNDALVVVKNQKSATALTSTIAAMDVENKLLFTQPGRSFTPTDQLNLVKFAELRTHTKNPAIMARTLGQVESMQAAEGGGIATTSMLSFARRFGAGVSLLSYKGLMELLPTMQAMGGAQLGTSLSTLQKMINRGQALGTGKRGMAFAGRMGLLNAQGKIKGVDLLNQNPTAWLMQDIIPSLEAHGYNTSGKLNQALSTIFPGRIPKALIQLYENFRSGKDKRTYEQGLRFGGIFPTEQIALATSGGAVSKVSKAWENMTTSLAKLFNPAIIGGLNSLTQFLQTLTQLLQSHFSSTLSKGIGKGASAVWSVFGGAPQRIINEINSEVRSKNKIIAPPAHPSLGGATHSIVNVHMDSKIVSTHVVKNIASSANRPQAAGNNIISDLIFTPPGLNLPNFVGN